MENTTTCKCILKCNLHAAAGEMLSALEFSLSVHKAQGQFDLSERMAVERIQTAILKAKGEIMEKLRHVKGPYRIFGENSFDIYAAPHSCSDPQCPGEINQRKLKAAEEMAALCRKIKEDADFRMDKGKIIGAGSPKPLYHALVAALSSWDKARKGEATP